MDPTPLPPYETTWEDWVLGGGARAAFARPELDLEVEIGPGDDSFLLDSARAHPDTNWLGIEYSHKRVRRMVRRIERVAPGIGNLRLIWRPAVDVVGPFLAPERVTTYHVYFPDPWPKAHHARYRLFHPAFAAALASSLVAGGRVLLATDAEAYAEEILEAFSGCARMESAMDPPGYAVRAPGDRLTVFEERWRAAGRHILKLEFRKVAS